ncbi:COG4223 family protein [Phenylobacterium sp.]|uniref:COG4223 family protein n=1 Tax=Phenylobacterium sp. TaxID=1871053 RepID=UPI002732C1F2|nr:hypothetical protein [Phenylobacterium sp.]MDP3660670.1 hypothetical protein [Phenylobacterium sp.]
MSVAPDPLPPDPADDPAPALMGRSFWAMIAFSVLCVVAGAAIVAFLPGFLTQRSSDRETTPALVHTPPAVSPPPVIVAAPAATSPAAPSPDLDRLDARIAALEAREAGVSSAAAGALAAAALVEASQGSRPFAGELAALEAVSPPSAELQSLRRLAEQGAPSRAALASGFPDYAARAAVAGRAPGDGAGLLDRALYALTRVVSVRRVGEVPGSGVDAVLARAERLVEDGEIDLALKTLDSLPPGAREAIAPWRLRAERRAEIDRRVASVRSRALQDLTSLQRPAS